MQSEKEFLQKIIDELNTERDWPHHRIFNIRELVDNRVRLLESKELAERTAEKL